MSAVNRLLLVLALLVAGILLQLKQDGNRYTERRTRGVVVVTGATSGIGFELAKRLQNEDGFTVFGTYRSERDIQKLEGINVQPLYMDVANLETIVQAEAKVRQFVEDSKKEFVGIVSNAGVLNVGPYERVKTELLAQTIDVHLKGTLYFTKVFMDLIRSQKGGRIVIMGSLAAELLPPANAAYNAAKAGQNAFALSLRQELAAVDTSVSLIVCGETRGTNLHENRQTKDVDWSGGYEVFQKAFDFGSKWMGESVLGTTFEDLHSITRHALTAEYTQSTYWAPAFLEYLCFMTPRVFITKMMKTPPPDFLL